MRGLPINKKFFSSWNSKMSYVLGFISADGSLGIKRIKKDGSKQYILNITNKELPLLRKIKKVMEAYQKIGVKPSGYNPEGKYYFFQCGQQEICRDLFNLGIKPGKTFNSSSVEVPQKYFSDFVRGFFDGDGTVYIYKVNGIPQIKASFKGYNFGLITDLNQKLCRCLDILQKTIHQEISRKGKAGYYIDFYIDDCEKLAEFMYRNNPSLYLPRKRRIFEKWKLMKRRHYIKQNYPSKIGWHLNQKVFA